MVREIAHEQRTVERNVHLKALLSCAGLEGKVVDGKERWMDG